MIIPSPPPRGNVSPKFFTRKEKELRSIGRRLFAFYVIASALCAAILINTLPLAVLQFTRDFFGVIEYFEAKGRDAATSSAFFISSISSSPLALASWHYSHLAGRRKAPRAKPWLTLAGIAYAVPLISGMIVLRPSGQITGTFSLSLLNLIVRNDALYFALINSFIWALCAFIYMSLIYPASLFNRIK